jgi:tetratricopeptide (TPR) repeat protein
MARHLASVTLLLLLLGGCTTAQIDAFIDAQPVALRGGEPIGPPAADAYAAGKAHLGHGRLGLAHEEFRRALTTEGANVRTLNALAIVYDELQRFDLAARYYAHALELDPHSPQTLNNYGRSLLRQGKAEQALPLIERARLAAEEGAKGEAREVVQANLELARVRLARPLPATAPDGAGGASTRAAGDGGLRIERTGLDRSTLRTAPAAATHAPPARSTAAARTATVEVANGTGRRHMAARMATYLRGHGLNVNRLLNARHYRWQRSQIRFRPGFEEAARELRARLPIEVAMEESDAPLRDVHLTLGADLSEFDAALLAGGAGG